MDTQHFSDAAAKQILLYARAMTPVPSPADQEIAALPSVETTREELEAMAKNSDIQIEALETAIQQLYPSHSKLIITMENLGAVPSRQVILSSVENVYRSMLAGIPVSEGTAMMYKPVSYTSEGSEALRNRSWDTVQKPWNASGHFQLRDISIESTTTRFKERLIFPGLKAVTEHWSRKIGTVKFSDQLTSNPRVYRSEQLPPEYVNVIVEFEDPLMMTAYQKIRPLEDAFMAALNGYGIKTAVERRNKCVNLVL